MQFKKCRACLWDFCDLRNVSPILVFGLGKKDHMDFFNFVWPLPFRLSSSHATDCLLIYSFKSVYRLQYLFKYFLKRSITYFTFSNPFSFIIIQVLAVCINILEFPSKNIVYFLSETTLPIVSLKKHKLRYCCAGL